MDKGFSGHDTGQQRILPADDRMVPAPLGKHRRQPPGGNRVRLLTLQHGQDAERRATQVHRLFQQDVEDRLKLAGRGIDDPQDLSNRLLLLQCLARLGQQPRILHRDDRLRREILQQRDLLVGERPHLLPIDLHNAEQAFVLAQRHTEIALRAPPRSTKARRIRAPPRSILLRCDICASIQSTRRQGALMSIVPGSARVGRARLQNSTSAWGPCACAAMRERLAVIDPQARQMRPRTAASPFRASRRTPARGRRARN